MISGIKWHLIISIIASFAIILLALFKWSIIDRITPFMYIPLAGAIWLFFIISAITSLTCMLKYKQIGMKILLPFSVMVVAFLVVYFVPFTDLWLKADFLLYKKERTEIVRKVYDSTLKPNVSHNEYLIDLGDSYPLVSMGGNQIVVEEHAGLKYVFFYTFRGVLDNYSGFIYVPNGGDPKNYSDLNESDSGQITHFAGNWYYASHH